MRLIYVILAHTEPDLTVRLVNKLDGPEEKFVIHVDKKAGGDVFSRYEGAFKGRSNVLLVPRRVAVYWGDFSVVQAKLNALRFVRDQGFEYDYVILLSGTHYPIKSRDVIRRHFQTQGGKLFLAHHRIPTDAAHTWSAEGGGMDRVLDWHFYRYPWLEKAAGYVQRVLKILKLDRLVQRKYKFDLQLYGGCNWLFLDKDAVDYMLAFVGKNPAFVSYFRFVKTPAEIFFHTIVMNSPHRDRVVNDDLLYVEWPKVPTAHPRVLSRKDLPRLAGSDKLFARKFDYEADPGLFDEIDGPLTLIRES